MRQNRNELLRAVRYALYMGTAAAVGLTAAPAFAQDEGADKGETLETIVVTGSRIRRVDLETSSPVFVIDKSAIEKTGKLTIGDLLQEAPSIAGAATNPGVNNGGGAGASTVSLRGLGSQRTLLLINGQRVFYNDVNSIPINMVERIEVLKDGASAVYGSDAIGGVVNFITRRDFQGMEASVDYGVSDADDGERKGGSLTIGHSSDRGSMVVGLTYNKQDAVSAANRDYSQPALYYYHGAIFGLGSGTIPNGRYVLPRGVAESFGLNCPAGPANVSVTRIDGRPGTSSSDFRCYQGSGPGNDTYDYSPFNILRTPQERAGLFAAGNYRISDNVEAYLEVFTNKTRSNYQLAPLPLILGSDSGAVISAQSIYNPFGVTVNSGGIRMSLDGNRIGNFTTTSDQLNTGLRGSFGDTWTWDAGISWARVTQGSSFSGYYFKPGLRDAVGPSFRDANGNAFCGTPGAVIANCVPINLLGLEDQTAAGRANLAELRKLSITPSQRFYSNEKIARFNLTGEIVELPAGALSIALGGEYRKDYQSFTPDFASSINDPAVGECQTSTDACRSASSGELSVREFYAELFIPVLRDVFLAKSLNFTLGSRYSDYSAFGDTTNSKIGIEWRPIDDVLFRGTVAEVFRSPTISDLFGGVTPSADTYTDPCSGAGLNLSNPACAGLAAGFQQTTPQTSALQGSNDQLLPESGKSFTWGVVYDPSWLEGFSTSVDVWRIYLTDTIGILGTQTIIDQCYNFGRYCNLFTRELTGLGDIDFVNNRTQNVGRVDTSGIDLSFKYRLPETAWGNFRFALDTTYVSRYDSQKIQGDVTTQFNNAGSYVSSSRGGDGNYARWRGYFTVGWNLGAFDASWRARYIGPTRVGALTPAGDGYTVVIPVSPGSQSFRTGSLTYHNLQFGYKIEPLNTSLELGVDNVFDKQPPQLFQFGFDSNTDARTYDTIGRYYWARVGVKF
jgi:iron complex outermembrane recepter protein